MEESTKKTHRNKMKQEKEKEEEEEHSKVDKEIAKAVKDRCDETFGETWHCIVGEKFASWVTHEKDKYLYFLLGKHAILVFKTS